MFMRARAAVRGLVARSGRRAARPEQAPDPRRVARTPGPGASFVGGGRGRAGGR